jgi:hypothetical protein
MSDYVIGSGLTEQQLKAASFWVRHGLALRRAGYASLIVLNSILWVFILWSLLDAYVISAPRERAISRIIAQNTVAHDAFARNQPLPVQPTNVLSFDTTDGRQDFLVELNNPNPQWWADFTYQFDLNGQMTPARSGFLLPSSQRYLSEVGWKGKQRGTNPSLKITDVRWHRVDPSQVELNYPAFKGKHLQLSFTDVKYATNLQIEGKTVSQTSFTLQNDSSFGFWNTELTVVLLRVSTPVAVTKLTVQNLKPGEKRPITLNWYDNLSAITKTDIQANVNILDPQAYLPSDKF